MLRGNTAGMGLDEVLDLIATNGLDGILSVQGPRSSIQLYFLSGKLVVPHRVLGLPAQASGELVESRRQGCAQALQKVLTWEGVSYAFQPGRERLPADLTRGEALEVDPSAVLIDFARWQDETRRFRAPERQPESDGWDSASSVLKGRLDGIGLPALLQTLRDRRRTGTLTVGTRARRESLYFREGEAYAVLPTEDLEGELFTQDLLGRAGRATVRSISGRIDLTRLSEEEERELRDRFIDVMFWEGAAFRFLPDALPPEFGEAGRRVALRTERFLMDAIQALQAWEEQVQPVVEEGRSVYRFVNAEAKLQALRGSDRPELLTLIDGLHTFDELVRRSGCPRLEAGRLMVVLFRDGALVRCNRVAPRQDLPGTAGEGARPLQRPTIVYPPRSDRFSRAS